MHAITALIAERIRDGLKRKSLTTCSRWAEECRVMGSPFPGKWTFKRHPWLKEMHDSQSTMNVGQKSAQMGFTEWALNVVFFNIDVRNLDCLYVLPAQTPDASQFSAGRFDPALELSEHLSKLFSDVKNVGHKRAGATNLYVRGSKSRSGLKSIPTAIIILDEVDEMKQANIPLALERSAGQIIKQNYLISTPTINNFGINSYYLLSSQEHFNFKCPHCSKFIQLTFPESLVVTAEEINDPKIDQSYLCCKECKGVLDHAHKSDWLNSGNWVADYGGRAIRGFHVNQMYSYTVSPVELAKGFLKSQLDPSDEQEFWNSKLGLPHEVRGARITDSQFDQCKKSYKTHIPPRSHLITMGVDIGKWLHFEICDWYIPSVRKTTDISFESVPKVVHFGKLLHFEELDKLMIDYGIDACVVDQNPERRKAYEFASRFHGRVKLCTYGQGIQGKQISTRQEKAKDISTEHSISVDRTSWLDLALGRFKNNTIELPLDISHEYKLHLKALVRVYEKDKDGNPTGRYVKGNDDDHYAHSRNYCEMALLFALGLGSSQDISSNIL